MQYEIFPLASLFILSTEVTYLLINIEAVLPLNVTKAQIPSLAAAVPLAGVYAYEKLFLSPG
jgi:hypothetical protein